MLQIPSSVSGIFQMQNAGLFVSAETDGAFRAWQTNGPNFFRGNIIFHHGKLWAIDSLNCYKLPLIMKHLFLGNSLIMYSKHVTWICSLKLIVFGVLLCFELELWLKKTKPKVNFTFIEILICLRWDIFSEWFMCSPFGFDIVIS